MEDRELLEAAAKAAGIHIDKSPFNGGGAGNTGFDCMGNAVLDWHNNVRWNPLTDNADALNLAVNLRQTIHRHDPDAVCVGWGVGTPGAPTLDGNGPWFWKEWLADNPDVQTATRRAIVRAAAALSKGA